MNLTTPDSSFIASTGNFEKALEDYESVLSHDPKNTRALLGKAAVLLPMQRLDVAYLIYQDLIRTVPNCYPAHAGLGLVHYSRGDTKAAVTAYTKSLELHPNDAEVYHQRAASHLNNNDFDAALADCNRYLELNPCDASVKLLRAQCHLQQSHWQEAIADFTAFIDSATSTNPTDAHEVVMIATFERARAKIQYLLCTDFKVKARFDELFQNTSTTSLPSYLDVLRYSSLSRLCVSLSLPNLEHLGMRTSCCAVYRSNTEQLHLQY